MNDHEDESAVIKYVCTIETVQNVVLLLVLSSTAVLLYGTT